MSISNCPLCHLPDAPVFHRDEARPYHRCPRCALIFVPTAHHLSRDEEKERYDHHQNDPDDPRYRAFLDRLAAPLANRLSPGARGLDYGCGPGPTLSLMLTERGFPTQHFDPIYADDRTLLEQTYDFVTCTEVVEHFRRPAEDWETLTKLLRHDGMLAVMTQLVDSCADFSSWHYRRDDTHICFYARDTLKWIAGHMRMRPAFINDSVILFTSRQT